MAEQVAPPSHPCPDGMPMEAKSERRARDFWTALLLIVLSCFFLWRTTDLPFFDARSAGVDSARWYNSAALVPFCIFGALLAASIALLVIAIRDGGTRSALSAKAMGFELGEALRLACIGIILSVYIFALVPRVDFVLASALVITALVWGFHTGDARKMGIAATVVAAAGLYALILHFPRAEWSKPHDDDIVTLGCWLFLLACSFVAARRSGRLTRVDAILPVLSLAVPLVLVCAMAFGFRQNVPNRTGLIFGQLEYHYYVTVKPFFQER